MGKSNRSNTPTEHWAVSRAKGEGGFLQCNKSIFIHSRQWQREKEKNFCAVSTQRKEQKKRENVWDNGTTLDRDCAHLSPNHHDSTSVSFYPGWKRHGSRHSESSVASAEVFRRRVYAENSASRDSSQYSTSGQNASFCSDPDRPPFLR